MLRNKKGQDFDNFKMVEGWAMVYIPPEYANRRLKLPPDLEAKRKEHMQKLYSEGTPYLWIAKLYNLTLVHVRRIVQNLPNK